MRAQRLGLAGLVLAGGILAVVALRAPEPTYSAPRRATPALAPLVLSQPPLPGNVVRTFDVEGICCRGCGGKLREALMALEGVQEVAVDPLKGQVSASVRPDLERERLAAALTFDQYTARPR